MNAAFVGGIGVPELLIVLAIVLVAFGGRKLPALGRQLGSGMREFKDSVTGKSSDPPEVEATTPEPGEAPVVDGEVVTDRR